MNNSELLNVLENIEREKGINKEFLFKAIESAMASAARKVLGSKDAEVSAVIDRDTGVLKIMSDGKEINSAELGRISAQTAKQVIMQKIHEAERDIVYEDYLKRVGTITNGTVHRFEKGDIIMDLGKAEAILPKSQQSPRDRYKQGERVRAYILEVNKLSHGAQIVLSRSDAAFVKKLFEIEVPEIADGIVEVRAIAREAGERTKFAVWSKDDKVDAVGACVGMRGQRVKDIVRELQGERVDIIRWSDDLKEYVKAAIAPAETSDIKIDKEHKKVEIMVADDQLSIGIGKHGQNIRLASKLVGWEMDIRGKEEKAKAIFAENKVEADESVKGEVVEKPRIKITDIGGVGPKIERALLAAGYDTVEKIKSLTIEDLTQVEGIGKKIAEKIVKSAKEA